MWYVIMKIVDIWVFFYVFFYDSHTYKKKCEISGIFVKISSIKAYGNRIVHGKSNEVILFQSSMIF